MENIPKFIRFREKGKIKGEKGFWLGFIGRWNPKNKEAVSHGARLMFGAQKQRREAKACRERQKLHFLFLFFIYSFHGVGKLNCFHEGVLIFIKLCLFPKKLGKRIYFWLSKIFNVLIGVYTQFRVLVTLWLNFKANIILIVQLNILEHSNIIINTKQKFLANCQSMNPKTANLILRFSFINGKHKNFFGGCTFKKKNLRQRK